MASVTIIADASWCPNTHVGGYGFWIASDRGKQGGSGAFRTTVVSSTAAEMMALVNALHQACKCNLVQSGDRVLLQTDCQDAIRLFSGQAPKYNERKPEEVALMKYMTDLIGKAQIAVTYRHVKGHTDGKQPRLYINNKCDEFAKRAMRRARHEFYLNNKESK
jgi:ribonuclease HI